MTAEDYYCIFIYVLMLSALAVVWGGGDDESK